jgi:hypothetical protein
MTADVAAAPEGRLAPDPDAGPCDPLDEMLIAMVIERTLRARDSSAARAEAGLPARKMAWEYAMVKRYAARLGPQGAEIARAVLVLAHSDRPLPGD